MKTDPQAATGPVAPDLLLVVFIHGFKGNDETFGQFPEQLQLFLTESVPDVTVECIVFPQHETKEVLAEAVDRFAEWLVALTIEREAAHGGSKVKVVLCGHSMGGLLAADTLARLADTRPYPGALLWPRVIALIAFDTPYLGLHPSALKDHAARVGEFLNALNTLKNGYNILQFITTIAGSGVPAWAQALADTATAALTALPTSLWQRHATPASASTSKSTSTSKSKSTSTSAPAPASAPAPSRWRRFAGAAPATAPAPQPTFWQRFTGSAPAPPPTFWQRFTGSAPPPPSTFWQRFVASAPAAAPAPSLSQNLAGPAALAVGGMLLVAALRAAYARCTAITDACKWVDAHLRYLPHLRDERELRARLRRVEALGRELGVRFRVYYARVAPLSPQPRTFCAVPPAHEPGAAHWVPAPNGLAESEMLAHVGMFESSSNDGYDQLGENTAALIREAIVTSCGSY